MSVEHPKTVAEWEQHLAGLSGEALRSKALAANGMHFVEMLREEGYAPKEIEAIFILLGRRFRETKQVAPPGGLYDLAELADRPLPVS